MILPLLAGIVLLVVSFAGLFGIARALRRETQTQIRLDRCVARAAADFTDVHEELQARNLRIAALRAAISAALSVPPSLPPLRAALTAQVLLQDGKRGAWKARQTAWLARKGCGSSGDTALPLPGLAVMREPPDAVGQQPLRRLPGAPSRFFLLLSHARRSAAAEIRRPHETPLSLSGWSAVWISARHVRAVAH